MFHRLILFSNPVCYLPFFTSPFTSRFINLSSFSNISYLFFTESNVYSVLREEKFEIENMIKIPYINSFNMDNLFVSAILR